MAKKIPLTQGQEAIVDDHWHDYLIQWKWYALWSPLSRSFYAVRYEGKIPFQKAIYMARVVAGTPDDMLCDHIYHNTLDNRESELRNVTHAQNIINRGVQQNSTTGVAGVVRRKDSGRYRAILKFERKYVLNKTFPTIEQAITARQEAEKKYFGEFAYKESK